MFCSILLRCRSSCTRTYYCSDHGILLVPLGFPSSLGFPLFLPLLHLHMVDFWFMGFSRWHCFWFVQLTFVSKLSHAHSIFYYSFDLFSCLVFCFPVVTCFVLVSIIFSFHQACIKNSIWCTVATEMLSFDLINSTLHSRPRTDDYY